MCTIVPSLFSATILLPGQYWVLDASVFTRYTDLKVLCRNMFAYNQYTTKAVVISYGNILSYYGMRGGAITLKWLDANYNWIGDTIIERICTYFSSTVTLEELASMSLDDMATMCSA